MSLLDIINKKQPATVQPIASQTEQARSLLSAASGKQQTQTGPRQSALGEQVARQQTQAAETGLLDQAKILGEQQRLAQAELSQQQRLQQQSFRDTLRDLEGQAEEKSLNILQEFSQGQRSLNNAQDIAALETAGALARLENQQYVNNLQAAGARKRLDDKSQLELELAKEIFDEQVSIFRDDVSFAQMIESDDREFQEVLSSIDINSALQVAEAANKGASSATMISGAGQVFGDLLTKLNK